MSNKQLRIPFNSPLHPQDTEFSTYGCRQNNPDICGNNGLPGVCAFASDDCICKNYLAHGRSSSKSSKNQAAKLSFILLFTHILSSRELSRLTVPFIMLSSKNGMGICTRDFIFSVG